MRSDIPTDPVLSRGKHWLPGVHDVDGHTRELQRVPQHDVGDATRIMSRPISGRAAVPPKRETETYVLKPAFPKASERPSLWARVKSNVAKFGRRR